MPGILYLIPNTLGQAEQYADPTHPLAQIIPDQVQARIAQLDYFVAENAKTTRAFLKLVSAAHAFAKPLQAIEIAELNVNTQATALPALLEPLLQGRDAGLISEAGVPAVADPGAHLVSLAHARGITVKPCVGPSSLLLALMASGLNGQSFAFHGYLPIQAEKRMAKIKELEKWSYQVNQTQLFIETPYRNNTLLDALIAACRPTTQVCIATDLTLVSESIKTQPIAKWKNEVGAGNFPDFHRKPTVFLLLAK